MMLNLILLPVSLVECASFVALGKDFASDLTLNGSKGSQMQTSRGTIPFFSEQSGGNPGFCQLTARAMGNCRRRKYETVTSQGQPLLLFWRVTLVRRSVRTGKE
jgi:hypothetical protein